VVVEEACVVTSQHEPFSDILPVSVFVSCV
jgi:hypothetical protein